MTSAVDHDTPLELDDLLPGARFVEVHRRTVDRPIDTVWPAALAVTAKEIRSFGPLLALRGLPSRIFRRADAAEPTPQVPLLDEFEAGGFLMLHKDATPSDGRAMALFGAAGRFWSPMDNDAIPFANAADFATFAEPDHAITACRLEAIDNGDGTTLLETETRVDGTDAGAVRKFAPYWALIRLPSGLIRRDWLAAVDRRANSS